MSFLEQPITIKHLSIKNRLVMPPMATAASDELGHATQKLYDYYAEKSKGSYIGLIITEHSFVHPLGKASKGQLSIASDTDIEGLKPLTNILHQNNTSVFAQIKHAGGKAKRDVIGCEPLSASAVMIPQTAVKELPKEMTLEEIEQTIQDFAKAALRVKEAGFDGVEIHAAHGYLLSEFFSPLTNKRTDAYNGKTLEGRMKLHLDIIAAVRQAVGPDYPIALRLGACDYMEGGTTIEDSVLACQAFEQAGVDLLDISGGFSAYINPERNEPGYFSELSSAIKQAVHIPVILTGGITKAQEAEELLQAEKADMIGVGRAILKDSDWAKNAILSLR